MTQFLALLVAWVLISGCTLFNEPSVQKITLKSTDIPVSEVSLSEFEESKGSFWLDSVSIQYHQFEDSTGLTQTITHYLPNGAPQSRSIVLYFGGGWMEGSARAMRGYCEGFAQQGFHCFAPSYRTLASHGTGVEEALWDATQTFQWIHNQADSLQIDPHRIWAGGSSAGGLLAAWQEAQGYFLWVPVLRTTGLNGYRNELITPENDTQVDVNLNLKQGIKPQTSFIFIPSKDNLVPVEASEEYCQLLTDSRTSCSRYIFDASGHNIFYDDLQMRDYTIFVAAEILKFL